MSFTSVERMVFTFQYLFQNLLQRNNLKRYIQTCSAISNIMSTQNWFLPVVKTAMDAAVAVLIASSEAASTSAEI
jgi:hypothetical protein